MSSNHIPPSGIAPTDSNEQNEKACIWASVILGVVGVASLFWQPIAELIGIVFVFYYALFVWTKDDDKTRNWVCITFMLYLVANGFFVAYHSPQLSVDPQLWIANRLLYVVGIALFGTHLVNQALETLNVPSFAIAVGFIFIFAAFVVYYFMHQGQPFEPKSWYEPEMLWDDVLMGFALCFLIAGTEHIEIKKP
jgi:protein-S-isoprenylcysteine O-methyltransferase Ste14